MAFQRNQRDNNKAAPVKPQPASNKGGKGKGGKGNKPDIPTTKEWMAEDQIYQRAKTDIGSAWSQFKNQQDVALNRSQVDLSNQLRDMRQQKQSDIRDINADYGARGLGNSGLLYNQIQNVYKPAYEKQVDYAKQAFTRTAGGKYVGKGEDRHWKFDPSSDLGMQLANQKLIKDQQKKNAWYEALLRKFQKYGLTGYGA